MTDFLVMKYNMLSTILCFCSALVVANSQTVPYFHFLGENLTNHSFVDLNSVGFNIMNVHCRTDLETCCDSDSGDDRGDWFYPSGDRLTFNSDEPGTGVYFLQRFKSVDLHFPGPAFPSDSGIYKCTIETIAVHSEDNEDRTTREVLYLGLYASGGDVTIPMDINFTQDSEPDGQTIQFTLTCISVGGPATTVTWTRDSESLSGGSTMLNDSVTGQYVHTLTIVGRLEGVYTCNVSNNKPSSAVRSLTVEAPDPPSDLQIAQTGQRSVRVSWIPSPGSSVNVTSYTINLTPRQGEEMVSHVDGSETSTEITDLTEAMTYSVTIVANSNTLSSNVTGPENITLEAVMIALFAPSPVVIGSSISIVCSVTLPDGLTGPPTVAWLGPKYIPVSSTMSYSGQVFNATLDINNIATSRAGKYMCTANISIFIVSEIIDIIIQVPSPLPALPNIIEGHSTPLYAATSYSLTCNYTLNELIDISLSVVVSWTVNGSEVDTSQSRITTPSNSLVFHPLALSDGGSYACRVSVSAQQYIIVQGPQHSSPVDIMIEDLPPPQVSTSSDSQLNIDDQQALDCSVNVVPFLIAEPTLEWLDPAGTTIASTTGQSLSHTINVERTSVAGLYVCRATVNVAEISQTTTSEGYTSISVQMPQPNVVISSNRTGILYAGSSLRFTCTVSLDSSVDTIPNVSTSWMGPRAIPGDWYTVIDASGSGLMYTGSLSIAPLADDRDDGTYTCSATVTSDNYILEATASASTTLEVTNLPRIEVEISTSGLLLSSQSITFECRANIVDGLIELPSLWLEAPNGTILTQKSSTTTLQYTLPSLDTSDGGVYTCMMVLVIAGSGINRQRKIMKEITVVDAYPVDQLRVVSNSNSSMEFSWQPPQFGHDFTTAFKLTCVPLLSGIPFPQPLTTNIGADVTTQLLTDLHSGVPYNCSVVTVTSQGESEPRSVVNTTVEIAPSGPPLSFEVAVGVNDVTFSWSPPEITLRNGEIIAYSLSCSPHGSTIVTIKSNFAEPGPHAVSGFSSSTEYNCSLVASNNKGNSPPATKSFTTQDSSESAGFDSVPVVSGVVVAIFIIAVMAIVITVMVLVAKRHRYKYILRRARPNAYVTRGLDSGSATVTANLSADYGAKNGATRVEQSHEYEMIPIATYSTLPPGKRQAPGYKDGEVHITANTHVTSPMDTHPTENGKGSRYEMIQTYSNTGPGAHLYEVPKLPKTDETLSEVRSGILQYAIPRSRQNTMTRSLSLSTRNSKGIPPQYDMPRSRNNTLMQGPSSFSTVTEVPQNLYSIPHSRQNTSTQQSSAVEETSGKTSHYDKLDEPSSKSNIPATIPRENEPETTGQTLNTYAVPRSSTISQEPYSPLVAIDLDVMGGDRPILAPTGEKSSQIKSSK